MRPRSRVRTITVEGVVAAVEGNQIILNVGGKAGVKVGDQFNVERVTKEIKDPTTCRHSPAGDIRGRGESHRCG